MNLDLEPIKEAISKATPGPWRWGVDSLWSVDGRKVLHGRTGYFIAPDGDVIANSHRWISLLIDEVEELRARLDYYDKAIEAMRPSS